VAEPRRVAPTRDDYADQVGADALARQEAEAEIRFDCCGELKASGHHQMCRKADDGDSYAVVDGQESLL
jgi:hypothetical protein